MTVIKPLMERRGGAGGFTCRCFFDLICWMLLTDTVGLRKGPRLLSSGVG